MQRSTFIALIASAAVGLSTIAAMANSRGPDFSTLDADGNGEITQAELQARGAARFAAAPCMNLSFDHPNGSAEFFGSGNSFID